MRVSSTLSFFIILVLGTRAVGLVINPTYDSSVTSLSNAAQWESGFQAAIQEIENAFSDPITLNITLKANPGTSIFGHSNYTVHNTYTYQQVRGDLLADATTAADRVALGSLKADPTMGGNFVFNDAQAKALGLRAANDPSTDGTVTIGTGYNFTYDPQNRAVPGLYDFMGIAEHEITEVMGRAAALGTSYGTGAYASVYQTYDLFRYTAANTPTVSSASTGVYFSIDGGVTDLRNFYGSSNGDYSDWAGTTPYTPDAANNNEFSGYANVLTAADLTALDVIGYDLVPEPSSALLWLAGAVVLASRRRRGFAFGAWLSP